MDLWHVAEDRADNYKARMLSALKSCDSVLKQFERLSRFHHETPPRCSCGKRDCVELLIIDAEWMNDLIPRMNRR